MNVIPQRTFHNVMDENPDEEVPEAQRVKGYKYGKTLVRIQYNTFMNTIHWIVNLYRCRSPKSTKTRWNYKRNLNWNWSVLALKLMCHVSLIRHYHFRQVYSSTTLGHHYQADVECITSLPGDPDAAVALSALVSNEISIFTEHKSRDYTHKLTFQRLLAFKFITRLSPISFYRFMPWPKLTPWPSSDLWKEKMHRHSWACWRRALRLTTKCCTTTNCLFRKISDSMPLHLF